MSLTNQDTDVLMKAGKQAVAYARTCSPQEALLKVATEMKLMPGQIGLVGHALNASLQNAQRLHEKSALSKFAEFEPADPNKVVSQIYSAEKSAESCTVGDPYGKPITDKLLKMKGGNTKPGIFKNAEKEEKDEDDLPKMTLRVFQAVMTKASAADAQADQHLINADFQVKEAYAGLCRYFRQPPQHRVSLAAAESFARAKYASIAGPVIDAVTELMPALLRHPVDLRNWQQEKRASATEALPVLSVSQAETLTNLFSKVASAHNRQLKLAKEKELTSAYLALIKDAQQELAKGRFRQGPTYALDQIKQGAEADLGLDVDDLLGPKKEAVFQTPAFGAALGSMFGQGMNFATGPDEDKMVERASRALDDPRHINELRRIRVSAMLNRFMTDPRDPISGYDPAMVVDEFNTLSQLGPHASMQPAVVGPILRRRLSGYTEPFENIEVAKLENTLADTKSIASRDKPKKPGDSDEGRK